MTSPIPSRPASGRVALTTSIASLCILFLALSVQKLWSADIWWQLRTGRLISETGVIPRVDSLSFTANGREWIELRWIYCLLSYKSWNLGGPALLGLIQVAALALTFGLLAWTARRVLVKSSAIAVFALAMVAGFSRFVYRPELATYLLTAVYLVMFDAASHGRVRRAIWVLPVLQVVWTNTHTMFIFGPIIAWLYAIHALLAPRQKHRVVEAPGRDLSAPVCVGLAAAVSLACFVNPYGWRGAFFPFLLFSEIGKSNVLGHVIDEFKSPFSAPFETWSWDLYAAVLLVIVTAATFIRNRSSANFGLLLLFASLVYLTATSVRNVGLLSVVALWCCLRNLEDIAAARKVKAADQASAALPLNTFAMPSFVLSAAMLFAAWYVATDRYSLRMGAPRRAGIGVVAQTVPLEAVSFVRDARPRGPIFHSMGDGAYLTWALPEYPVYIDGRLEVYGDRFVGEYVNLEPQTLPPLLDRWGINTVLLQSPRFMPHAVHLRAMPNWSLVHLDGRNALFVRNIAEHADLIARHHIDPVQYAATDTEDDRPPTGWRKWFGSVETPWRALGTSDLLLAFGGPAAAERALSRAEQQFPDDVDVGLRRAALLQFLGKGAEADRLLEKLQVNEDQMQWHDRLLVQLLSVEKRDAEILPIVERMIRRIPDDPDANAMLAPLRLSAGDPKGAIAAYRIALESHPTRWDIWAGLGLALESSDDAAAVDAYQRAIQLNPANPSLLNQVGIVHASHGRFDDARRMFEAALKLDPDYASARANLARLSGG